LAIVKPIYQNVDFGDLMTMAETAKLLRRSAPTIRALADREWHPLPCINTGMGQRKHRVFLRPSVLRWLAEEEHTQERIGPVQAQETREQKRRASG